MPRRWRRLFQMVLGLALAVGLLWYFFRGTDWAAAWLSVGRADPGLLALSFVANLASLAIRAYRWQVLLRPVKPAAPFARVWRFYMVGFAVSSVLPGRLGELIRPYLLARDQRVRFAPTFATVVTDRVIDLVVVLGLLATAFVVPSVLGAGSREAALAAHVAAIQWVGLAALALVAVTAAVLVLLRLRTRATLALLERLAGPLPRGLGGKAVEAAASFAEGVGGLDRAGAAAVAASTVATWGVLVAGLWCGLAAFGLEVPVAKVVFLLAVIALGVALPTPGGSGTYHAAIIVVAGQMWGLAEGAGGAVAAYAITGHLLAYLPVVAFGAYYLVRDGVDLARAAEEAGAAGQGGDPGPRPAGLARGRSGPYDGPR